MMTPQIGLLENMCTGSQEETIGFMGGAFKAQDGDEAEPLIAVTVECHTRDILKLVRVSIMNHL